MNRARASLHNEIGKLAIAGAEKILKNEIDAARNRLLIDDLIAEI